MKPAPFAYDAPRELDEVLALLAREDEDVKVLAGGQSLVPLLNFRLARPVRKAHRIGKNRVVATDSDFLRQAGEDDARLRHADARRLAVHGDVQLAQFAAIGFGQRL